MSVQLTAKRAGYTRYIIAEHGADDLYLWINPNTDLDDVFTAICADTGDVLKVKGYDCIIRDLDY